MNPLPDGHYRYRPLKEGDEGWDVFALQSALEGIGVQLAVDGDFGPVTARSVKTFQATENIVIDAIAGANTQYRLVLQNIWPLQKKHSTPSGLLRGQVESESGFWVGNHTSTYENGNKDVGVCQRHLPLDSASLRAGFDVPVSLRLLAERLRSYHDKYLGQVGAKTDRRAWELASGSWNAPAWTDTLARGGTLGPNQTAHIEAYIDRSTRYLAV